MARASVRSARCLQSPARLDAMLLRHVLPSHAACRGQRVLSMAVDKANCGGISLQAGCIVTSSGFAMVACPQARAVRLEMLLPNASLCFVSCLFSVQRRTGNPFCGILTPGRYIFLVFCGVFVYTRGVGAQTFCSDVEAAATVE